jgi:pullulanase/glycogen debranching enzyme
MCLSHLLVLCAGDVWHIALPQCDTSLLYAYRLTGENQDKNNAPSAVGHKFDEVWQQQQWQ